MARSIDITLPWPPSVNRAYRSVRGRVLISKDGRLYRTAVDAIVQERGLERLSCDDRISVDIVAFPPDRRRRDLDNLLKMPLDALEHAAVFPDDSQIDALAIERGPVEKDRARLEVRLEVLEKETP